MKCAHTVLPFITLVASMNKSVLCDVLSILEIGRNGKQDLNYVCVCLNFLQQNYNTINATMIHAITIITCTTN